MTVPDSRITAVRPAWLRYLVALLVLALAIALRLVFLQALQFRMPFLTLYPAVILASLFGGLWPGLLVTAIATGVGLYVWTAHTSSPPYLSQADLLSGVVFFCSGLIIASIAEGTQRAKAKRIAAAAELEQANAALQQEVGERSAAEQALRESEERFRRIFDNAAVGIAEVALDGRWLRVNDTLCRIIGYSREELLGKTSQEITHPDDLTADVEQAGLLLAGSISTYAMEKRYRCRDGDWLWVRLTASLNRDAQGKPLNYISVIEDIALRREAEERFRLSETQRIAIINLAPVAIFVLDAHLHIQQVNPRAQEVFGPAENVLGLELDALLHRMWSDQVADEVMAHFRETLATGESYSVSGFTEPRHGVQLRAYYDWEIHRIAVADGGHGIVCYFTDVTAHVEAQRKIRQTAESLRFMAESMPQKIVTTRPRGQIEYVNQQWAEFTGAPLQQVREQGWQAFLHPDDAVATEEAWRHALATGQDLQLEHRFRRHDGRFRWHLTRIHAMRSATGDVVMWIGSHTDIDDLKRAEAEIAASRDAAEAANRAKDHFLAALSHELRTPLTPVLMLAEAMEESPDLPPEVRRDFAMVRSNVELEARIIDDLLDVTRIAQGKLKLTFSACDGHDIIDKALRVLQADLEAKQQRLTLHLDAQRVLVRADSARLQQVFWNILKNAIKFSPAGGEIIVRTLNENNNLKVQVHDSGVGIPEQELNRIFDAFVQSSATLSSGFGGLGLGLSISSVLVREHHGRIWAESEGLGQGSTFCVELPLAAAPDPQPEPPAPQPSVPAPRCRRILLVEDHVDSRQALTRLLVRRGHEVVAAGSVAEARTAAGTHAPFDLVISDLGLPDGDGHSLMRELRRDFALKGIALSGYGTEADVRKSVEAGFVEHLTKPVIFPVLQKAIEHAVCNGTTADS